MKLCDLGRNDFQHARQVLHHIGIPKPQHRYAAFGKPSRTRMIFCSDRVLAVLAAIEFHSEPDSRREEIQYIISRRMLAAKINAELLVAEPLPQLHFNISELTSQLAGTRCLQPRKIEP